MARASRQRRAVALGARLRHREEGEITVLDSPGGFPFCVVRWDGEATVPGVAIWHMSFLEKDDTSDWQAYFHYRNRFVAAALHGPDNPTALLRDTVKRTLRHLLLLEYSAVALQHMALRDFLGGVAAFAEGSFGVGDAGGYSDVVVPRRTQWLRVHLPERASAPPGDGSKSARTDDRRADDDHRTDQHGRTLASRLGRTGKRRQRVGLRPVAPA